ncbi:unnamed protein product [Kuraishia capsulata CBS 1993]|uniref:Mannosyl-oligosaccharide glucosidase n=1 Tax=Kuraishia capsulata CBS 1993 TaxID=1382522 RepID=W6MQS7_9ASCO|nr:uncharacterized protein KUCA_T00004692001 [Kuraishia capsulata CBS 1993]CDK28708.1 unnamed protein product [Kuraishia capsulata CBS 1993]
MRVSGLQWLAVLIWFSGICFAFSSSEDPIDALYESASKDSLLWGPYRSNLYVGVRPRVPRSLLSGLMWFNVDSHAPIRKIKHFCDQGDDLAGFGWLKYDPRQGGIQRIEDNESHITLTSEFVKTKDGNWALRIKGTPFKGFDKVKTSLVFYTGLEGEGLLAHAGLKDELSLYNGNFKLTGYAETIGGPFNVQITDGPSSNKHVRSKTKLLHPAFDPSKTHHLSLQVPDDNIWKAKDIYLTLLQESIGEFATDPKDLARIPPEQLFSLRNTQNFEGNLHFVQKIYEGAFEFDIIFNLEESLNKIKEEDIADLVKSSVDSFDDKFAQKFQLQAPFNTVNHTIFAKEFLSQLMGGVSYFYGDHLVDSEADLDEESFDNVKLVGKPDGPHELFTAVPSRPFFPRGFYWDEGFHLLPILEYDTDFALEILKSWFSQIDEDGWIAREQILGPEARSKVPEEFQVQNANIANPPTLMLVFTKLLEMASKNQEAVGSIGTYNTKSLDDYDLTDLGDVHLKYPHLLASYAENIYPDLQRHYEWFRRTQRGELREFDRTPHSMTEAYRWKGRTRKLCLPSGIDDYPRAEADIAELNVDLISWIGVMTRSMKSIATLLGKKEDAIKYSSIFSDITQNIEDLHWSEKDQNYCDLSVDDKDEDLFVCHTGYVTLFPFLHKLIPEDSGHLLPLLKILTDPEQLWTDFGIRSLSKQDEFFHTEEDYWRGSIWINLNYLVLESLQHYGTAERVNPQAKSLAKKAYRELRENVVNNVYREYTRTGYAWEQYDEATGEGKRTKHFLGWTSLVVLMMKMPQTLE